MLCRKKIIFIFLLILVFGILLFLLESRFTFSLFAKKVGASEKFFVKEEAGGATYEGLFFATNEAKSENDIVGEFLYLKNARLNEIKVFFNAKQVFFEKIGEKKVFYLKTNLLKKEISAGEFSFNLQVIFDERGAWVYYPINFGSF